MSTKTPFPTNKNHYQELGSVTSTVLNFVLISQMLFYGETSGSIMQNVSCFLRLLKKEAMPTLNSTL